MAFFGPFSHNRKWSHLYLLWMQLKTHLVQTPPTLEYYTYAPLLIKSYACHLLAHCVLTTTPTTITQKINNVVKQKLVGS